MSCLHLDEFLENSKNRLAIKKILNAVIFPMSDAGFELKVSLICKDCQDNCIADTMLCASCIYSGCLGHGHIEQHFKTKGHCICISLEQGDVYCLVCGDYQYNEVCEEVLVQARQIYYAGLGMLDLSWRPAMKDLSLLKWVRSPGLQDPNRPTRGLVNMGNTCFLNVVIQALTHTPALRDFLLSDEHRCPTARASKDCLACELVRVAQELYRPEEKTPLALTNLLYMIWSHVTDLARYDQHDAHELFLAVLSLLHTHLSHVSNQHSTNQITTNREPSPLENSKNSKSASIKAHLNQASAGGGVIGAINNSNSSRSSSTGLEDDCECIVHQAFMATLESKIVYDCGQHTSRHLEVFRDLSLEIFRDESVSLESSFRSYFGSERMKDAQCSNCRKLGATKQYSLFQLPNIFSVHLKRCHAKSKVNTKVDFPQELDLAPFISNKKSTKSLWEDKYSLYSVINHRGQNSAGHYTVYVRTEDNVWCLCDDQNIHLVTLTDVLRSDAYMLFYHKNSLVMKA